MKAAEVTAVDASEPRRVTLAVKFTRRVQPERHRHTGDRQGSCTQ